MPRFMSMDNLNWWPAPLDLSTTNRDTSRPTTTTTTTALDCRPNVSRTVPTETSTGRSALLRRTVEEEHRAHANSSSMDNGSALLTSGTPTANSPTKSKTSDRRTRDTSKLPLRKRPFPAQEETLGASSALSDTGGDPLRTGSTDRPPGHFNAPPKRQRRTSDEAPTPMYRTEAAPFTDGFHSVHLHPFYVSAGRPYPRMSEFGLPPRVPPLPLSHLVEHPPLPNVAMVMCPDEDGDTYLHIAVVKGKAAVVHRLIRIMEAARKDLNIYNNLRQTPLHLAVITQQEGLVEGLLRAGADPTVLDRLGRTALHLCCEYGPADCLSAVLAHAASLSCLDAPTFAGLSPLHIAVQEGHKDLVRMLLSVGADINIKDMKSGQSPLMYAVDSNNVDMVQFLIESGSDVNGRSNSGNTALHGACGRGQVDTVRLLLKNGADSSAKNNHNDTPVMVAKNKAIADVLRGKSSTLSRSQDQPLAGPSSHSSNLTASGSSSPNQSPTFHL